MNQEKWIRKKKHCVSSSISPLVQAMANKGKGAYIWDMAGNKYLDFTGGWGCLIVGHSHPRIIKTAQKQIKKFSHTDFSALMYPPYVELAERLAGKWPGEADVKSVFLNSGAEAVENAIKFAKYYTNRNGLIVFDNAFHGRTYLTMAMTHKAKPYKEGFGPFPPGFFRLPFPSTHKDISVKKVLKKLHFFEQPSIHPACVVVEPIQGEGGFNVPKDGFLQALREWTKANDILLIADEIQSGMGRTGEFFAIEHWNVEPDMITVAKSLAAGFPLSGVIGKAEIMDKPTGGAIGTTYGGNPVCCAVACTVLDIIKDEGLLQTADFIGNYIRTKLKSIKSDLIRDIRGKGAMVAFELRKNGEPATEETNEVINYTLKNGVMLAKAGYHNNVIRFLVPLIISPNQLEEGLGVIEAGILKVG